MVEKVSYMHLVEGSIPSSPTVNCRKVNMPRLELSIEERRLIETLAKNLNIPMIQVFRRALDSYAELYYSKEGIENIKYPGRRQNA